MPKRTDPSPEDHGARDKESRAGKPSGRAADREHRKATGKRDGRRGDGKAAQRRPTGRRHSRVVTVPPHSDQRDGYIAWNE